MQADQSNLAKSIPSSTPFGFIDRPRLLRLLLENLSARLIVVEAPTGYGKTSLLADLAAHWDGLPGSGRGVLAWYSLDSVDDDAAVFVEGLVESVRRTAPRIGKNTLAALRGIADARAELPRLVEVLSQEIRDAGIGPVSVVLDDFHFIADKAILDALEQTVKNDESPLRLIIATEKSPTWYLSDLRVNQGLAEIASDSLLFTAEEIRMLLRSRLGGEPGPGLAESLAREVRGWPSAAAVAAAMVAHTGRPLPFTRIAPTEHGYGLLVKELLSLLPFRIRDGLVRSCLLPVVEPASLDSVVGISSPDAVVRAVEELALPAARVGESRDAIRFDPLFRAALERELASSVSPQDLRDLHKRVASYHGAQGEHDEAVRGFMKSWAYEDAAGFIDEVAGIEISRGHLDTVLRWLKAVPNSSRKGRPRLMVHEARALIKRGALHEARVLLITAEDQLRSAGDSVGLALRNSSWCALLIAEGRNGEATRIAEAALEEMPAEQLVERADLYWMLGCAREVTGGLVAAFDAASEGLLVAEKSRRQDLVARALSQLGHLAELRGLYVSALALTARAVQRSVLAGTEDLPLAALGGTAASIYLERDQPDEAAAAASIALEANRRLGGGTAGLGAELALARVEELSNGSPLEGAASELLARAANAPSAASERILIQQAAAASLMRRGRWGEGEKWARQALDTAVAVSHQPAVERSDLLGTSTRAMGPGLLKPLTDARRLRDGLSSLGDQRWLSAAHRIAAQSYDRLGIGWRARPNLKASLELAAAEGYIGMPLGLPIRTDRLFALAVRHGILPEYAGTLIAVDPERGRSILAPLLADKRPEVRMRAELAARGLEAGTGRAPTPRLPWPGTVEAAHAPVVGLQSLGGMNAFVDGVPADWPSADARTLAAYLIVQRERGIPREMVLKEVWPETPIADANIRLHVVLHQVRESLGAGFPAVDPYAEEEGYYLWDGAGCFIDVESFRTLVEEIEREVGQEQPPILSSELVALLERAVSIYQGEFLADLDYSWCVEQREDLRARLLRITRLLIDHYLAVRQWRDAIRHGLKSLKSNPLQEDVVRDLMVSYFRVGERDAVMKQYREVKRLLARDRGVWPSEETRQLRVRLLGK